MVFKIEWSDRAVHDFENVIDYLIEHWSEKTAKEFAGKLEKVLFIIEKMPFLYPRISKRKHIRKSLVTKHNAMYYRVKKEKITILALFDTRQDPKKVKL